MPFSKYTVLLVEDEPADIQLTRRALRRTRINPRLETAEDGELAVQYLGGDGAYGDRSQYPWPALMLLDLKLPRRGGIEVLEWVRTNFSAGELAVVVFSSSAEPSDIDRAYAAGANSYVQKPAKFEGLVHVVEYLLPYWLTINLPSASRS